MSRSLAVLFVALALAVPAFVIADTATPDDPAADALQAQADATTQQINALKNEIDQLQIQLNNTTSQKQTLQSAVKAIDLNVQKLTKSISLTNTQISQKDRDITRLSGGIATTSATIDTTRAEVAESLRTLAEHNEESIAATLLAGATLSDFFDEAAALSSLRSELGNRIEDLSTLKSTLVSSKTTATQARAQLAALQAQLGQQKQSLAVSRQSQADLLSQTQNRESAYQSLIAQKKAEEASFEADLLEFEKKLGLKTDTASLPPTGSGALRWPLDSIHITQYFGNTPFATQNAQIYGGKGHTGVDFAASPGTPVKAARSGIVLGNGNTDLTCPNASFGKWVFIKHDNGLSTLYAHLSVISVSKGQTVTTGQVVGYSGSTGYATGPHLHFGVYASSGSEIASFASASCKGKVYTMPVGDISAYLNPLSYLPSL